MPGMATLEGRLIELYGRGQSCVQLAEDRELAGWPLAAGADPFDRATAFYHLTEQYLKQGRMPRRRSSQEELRLLHAAQAAAAGASLKTRGVPAALVERLPEQHLRRVEEYLGLSQRRKPQPPRPDGRTRQTVVISDPHCPDHRQDLIDTVCARHGGQGMELVIGGDINDFENYGRWAKEKWNAPTIDKVLKGVDQLMGTLADAFATVTVMWGNHDLRLPKAMCQQIHPDLMHLGNRLLAEFCAGRHGAAVVENKVVKANGQVLDDIHYFHPLGDCLVSHAELCGKPVCKGVQGAVQHFLQFQEELGLAPFKVVLQAHTHKVGYYKEPIGKIHGFEIGAMCDVPLYALRTQKYGPPQHGYFLLVQEEGQTLMNESRLMHFGR